MLGALKPKDVIRALVAQVPQAYRAQRGLASRGARAGLPCRESSELRSDLSPAGQVERGADAQHHRSGQQYSNCRSFECGAFPSEYGAPSTSCHRLRRRYSQLMRSVVRNALGVLLIASGIGCYWWSTNQAPAGATRLAVAGSILLAAAGFAIFAFEAYRSLDKRSRRGF
jgi:hypothetical protein